jgi:hypothetical protein
VNNPFSKACPPVNPRIVLRRLTYFSKESIFIAPSIKRCIAMYLYPGGLPIFPPSFSSSLAEGFGKSTAAHYDFVREQDYSFLPLVARLRTNEAAEESWQRLKFTFQLFTSTELEMFSEESLNKEVTKK